MTQYDYDGDKTNSRASRFVAEPDTVAVSLPIRLRLPDAVIAAGPDACERWFVDLTLANEDALWVMELNAKGELELTMPPYEPADAQEGECFGTLYTWNVGAGRPGVATHSGGAYRLPNGAIRFPDAAWTHADNVQPRPADPPRARRYCPDFVVEIRSTSQSRPSDLAALLNKMQEYMDNGAKLGWFIDPWSAPSASTAPALPNRNCCKTRKHWTARTCCPASSLRFVI